MRFIIKKGKLLKAALYLTKTDLIHLQPDNWDDFGFVTGFNATFYPQSNTASAIEIGFVKILREFHKENIKTLDFLSEDDLLEFDHLSGKYCSLGQSEEYYIKLREQGEEFYNKYIVAMNDVYGNPDIGHKFEGPNNPGFEISLLRNSAAAALYAPLSRGISDIEKEDLSKAPHFNVSIQLKGAEKPHHISFDFRKVGELPNRIFVLVGKNGVGKTQVLGELAFLISGGAKSESHDKQDIYGDNKISSRGLFQNVIALSFSAFDDFEVPAETEDLRTSYRYWGVRGESDRVSTTEKLINRIYSTVDALSEDRKKVFSKYLKYVAPNLDLSDIIGPDAKKLLREKTSAGQRIMLATLTGLVSFLKDKSVLLFDEPETHLHPSMLANLMSVINGLLEDYNSYAVISTHSPIVLQQVPSKYVRVVRRLENTPEIDDLAIETFGENITEIAQEIFDVSDYERDYKNIFIRLLEENTPEKIMTMFDNNLGISAKALLHSLNKEGRKKH